MKVFNLNIPISKVDEEQRIVYGYATKEELDRQGDIVDYEASKKAFTSWAGNIREQHDSKRVIGKKVSMEFDDDEKQILVGAYISKSPDGENAWTKVKEGLFTGFSIGGKIKSIVKETLNKDDGSEVEANRITDYDLAELSLVDVPACPSAQLVMVKSADGKVVETEELHQSETGAPLPWFMTKYAFSPSQVNQNRDSSDTKNIEKQSKEHDMADAELEKVNVNGGEERDAEAKPVEQAETVTETKPAKEEKTVEEKSEEKSDTAEVKKGLYTVAQLAECVENLTWIVSSAEFESQYEGDDSSVPAQLKAAVAAVAAALVAMTQEEVAEIAEGTDVEVTPVDVEDVELADRPTDLEKSVDLVKMVDEKFAATTETLVKSLTDALAAKVSEAIAPIEERLKAVEAQPVGAAPQKQYQVVEKVADEADANAELQKRADDIAAHPERYSLADRTQLVEQMFKHRPRTNQ